MAEPQKKRKTKSTQSAKAVERPVGGGGWLLFALMVCALVAVFVPGLGRAAKGAHRWINLGPFSLQPIEFVKLFIIVVLSAYLEVQGGLIRRFGRGFAVPMAMSE